MADRERNEAETTEDSCAETVRKIYGDIGKRIETGPVQFNNDWPGVFIRGDNAAYFAMALDAILAGERNFISETSVRHLSKLLRLCRVNAPLPPAPEA
jgi:hypothetical protein